MEPACPAHGQKKCFACSRITSDYMDGEGGCTDCDYYAVSGMHWDSCSGRIRSDDVAMTHDPVNRPSHYVGQVPGIECQEVIGWFPHHIGAAMKYLWRHRDKGGVEDLRKAIKFIEFEIARLESGVE